jgi:hypothetical protein
MIPIVAKLVRVERGSGLPVNFTLHIKPLFRKMDREAMRFIFDLWAYEDVHRYAP